MTDPRDYKIELSTESAPDTDARDSAGSGSSPRPFLSVLFACCGVYQRIYRSPDGLRYEGHCPKCARLVNFVVGRGGTDSRFFVVK